MLTTVRKKAIHTSPAFSLLVTASPRVSLRRSSFSVQDDRNIQGMYRHRCCRRIHCLHLFQRLLFHAHHPLRFSSLPLPVPSPSPSPFSLLPLPVPSPLSSLSQLLSLSLSLSLGAMLSCQWSHAGASQKKMTHYTKISVSAGEEDGATGRGK